MISYLTINEAQSYFDTRLHSDVWEEATPDNQLKALISATRIIDNLRFKGYKTDSTQELEFPRYPATDVPESIVAAVCECALALLDDVDMESEIEALSASSFNYSTLRTTYGNVYPSHTMAGVPSAVAWRYLQPYLTDPNSVHIVRSD